MDYKVLLQLWESAGGEAFVDWDEQLHHTACEAVRRFAKRDASTEEAALVETSAWMHELAAVLGVLCTLVHAAGASAAPPTSLHRGYRDSAAWGMQAVESILVLLGDLAAAGIAGRLQLPGEPDPIPLPLHAYECIQAGRALLKLASLWDKLLPLWQEHAAQHGLQYRRQRLETAALLIWSALHSTQHADPEGMHVMGQRLAKVEGFSVQEKDISGLNLLLTWLFRWGHMACMTAEGGGGSC